MGYPYYYFVASLPSLDFDQSVSLLYPDFLEEARRHLSAGDFHFLTMATLDYDALVAPHPTLQVLADLNRRLKNEIALFRCKTLSRDSADFFRGDHYMPGEISESVAQAAKMVNPLEAQKALDLFRWKKFEELSSGHSFDLDVIIVYGLKLQILDRHHELASAKGQEKFAHYKDVEIFENIHL